MDNNMLNILKNLDAAEKGEKVDGTPSTAASEKNAMKKLLEGLDAQQRSVNQMPATHKMAKATGTKHPASKYLVGGEEGGFTISAMSGEDGAKIANFLNKQGIEYDKQGSEFTIHADRESLQSATVLSHLRTIAKFDEAVSEESVTEAGNLRSVKVTYDNGDSMSTNMAANLTDEQIRNYYAIGKRFNVGDGKGGDKIVRVADVEILEDKFGEKKPSKDVYKKQSFADIFKSMEEADDEKEFNMEKDFYNKLQQEKKALTKSDNGKFNLAEKESPEDEEGSGITTRDARAKFLIKQARAKYAGRADDDLGAVVQMMTDKDREHDSEIGGLDRYDHGQDTDINYNDTVNDKQEATIADILDRLDKLEKGKDI